MAATPNDETYYSLYKYERCFGDKTKRTQTLNLVFVDRSPNMMDLVNMVKREGKYEGLQYSYIIQKYINENIRYRRLIRQERVGGYLYFQRGDVTTTWEKYVWDDKKTKWRASSYRYDDEKV